MDYIEALALNFSLDTTNGIAEWWPLVPANHFEGRDGRAWNNANPQAVIDSAINEGADIPLDEEHSTEIKGPNGEPARARGFFKEYRITDGAIEGRVDLNRVGKKLLENKEYRYYSPAFKYNKDGVVTGLSSVGLTNKHNLYLPALNHREEPPMKLTAIALALGLAEASDEPAILAGIASMKSEHQIALNRAQAEASPTDLTKYVPVATHELALNRAKSAEEKLAEGAAAALESTAKELVEGAVKEGKIAPANRDDYMALCRQEGGMDTVKKLFEAAPKLLPAQLTPEGKPGEQATLSTDEIAVCSQLGLSHEEFIAAKPAK